MVQWGIIGAGNVAARFAASLEHEPESRLTAISCRNREKGERFLSNFLADRIYANHEELLHDRRIDAVYLSLPHGLHKEWAVKALQAGKAVLCEKPAALNAGEMREIAETARERDVLFMEAMKPRFVPLYQKIKALVSEGRIGSVVRVTTSLCNQFSFSPNHPTYHTQPGQGGALLDEGIYCASWLQDFLSGNASVTQIAANMKDGIDYYIDAQLDFLPGQTGRLECAFDRLAPRTAVIYGTHGWLEIEDFHRPQVLRLNADEEKTRIIRMPYETDDFYGEIHHFVECINNGRKESAIMPLSSSIACAEILDAVRESIKLTPRCLETLERQEAILQFDSFGSAEALALGNEVAELASHYESGVSAAIIRERDGLTMFQFAMDDKTPRNDTFMQGKRKAALAVGHSSLWAYVNHELTGNHEELFQRMPEIIPCAGAFPIRVHGEWVATLTISGLHEGKDHKLAVLALSRTLKRKAPVFPGVAV